MPFRFLRRSRSPYIILGHADDDQRVLLRTALERWGYTVTVASNGVELADTLSSAFREGDPPAALVISTDLPGRVLASCGASIQRWDWDSVVVVLHDHIDRELPPEIAPFATAVLRPLALKALRRVLDDLTAAPPMAASS